MRELFPEVALLEDLPDLAQSGEEEEGMGEGVSVSAEERALSR